MRVCSFRLIRSGVALLLVMGYMLLASATFMLWEWQLRTNYPDLGFQQWLEVAAAGARCSRADSA